jgi:sulfatase maturation enzyme AslB (radical SAM superfamily)
MNDYFCVLPFFGAEYDSGGFVSPCCLLSNDYDLEQIRSDMLNGIRTPACKKCWDLEDISVTSDRQLKNSAYDFYADKDIRFVEQDCADGKFSQQIIKLYTSNLCNSTCVTCGPGASTAWATLSKVKTYIKIDNNIIDNLPFDEIKMLNFVGGEPFYEQRNFDILNKLIEVGNTNVFLSFTTNGSTELTEYQKGILKHFKNLNVCLSIDGVGLRFEYLRYPLKWNILLKNIEFFKSTDVNLSVSYTISNVNILYYNETVDWLRVQGLNHNHIMVSYPAHFSPSALPLAIKKKINNHLIPAEQHKDIDDVNFINACEELKRQDQLKKIDIKNYLPEFYDIIPEKLR